MSKKYRGLTSDILKKETKPRKINSKRALELKQRKRNKNFHD